MSENNHVNRKRKTWRCICVGIIESSKSEGKRGVVIGIALVKDVPTSVDPICSSRRYLIAINNPLLGLHEPVYVNRIKWLIRDGE